ncbi:MAG: hypothetical protein JWM16_5865, partial [Verrucomicrobiales bacterium]|nr:hypothetical protein [Verrucomicrobiales bacterium]
MRVSRIVLTTALIMFAAIKSVHFMGIGGTAMASVAAAMQDKGVRVT